jgi:6-pyruvoyltetrahydropterin/6-carboxytetrahydropterin synthase
MPSFTLTIRQRFEAAHYLYAYRGKPEPIHGHTWTVELVLEADRLDKEGMGFDFVAARTALADLVARFDHRNINEIPPFDTLTPTTEHLAMWFFDTMVKRLESACVTAVTIWEGPDCSATYRP